MTGVIRKRIQSALRKARVISSARYYSNVYIYIYIFDRQSVNRFDVKRIFMSIEDLTKTDHMNAASYSPFFIFHSRASQATLPRKMCVYYYCNKYVYFTVIVTDTLPLAFV